MRRCASRIATILGLWTMAACASNGPPISPSEQALRAVRRELGNATNAGVEALEQAGPYQLIARYNPSQNRTCECPRFEVLYYGQWHRVFLDVQEDETHLFLKSYQEEVGFLPRSPELLVIGQPTATSRRCEGTGQRFTVFTVEVAAPLSEGAPLEL